jgi:hypothetical protein
MLKRLILTAMAPGLAFSLSACGPPADTPAIGRS